ncbi:MAG: hypothetical protein NZM38_00630 [Cytophagales bacterium]|nr:hypothetical protein [Cytophagales bacterium]MDW8383253.1 hypothetical protein [Flammeovirgaceae bacterium]
MKEIKICCFLISLCGTAVAQRIPFLEPKQRDLPIKPGEERILDKANKDSLDEKFSSWERPTIELNPAKEKEKKQRKTKERKNVFYDLKTRKLFVREGKGKKIKYIEFHVLKKYQAPNPYIHDKYYFDLKTRQIEVSQNVYKPEDKKMVLHGPYIVRQNGLTIEQGYFYIGGQHGRWEYYEYPLTRVVTKDTSYTANVMLLRDKKYFYKGFPRDAEITYYDAQKTKVQEVNPIQHGFRDGIYLSYYPSGNLKEKGKYQDGERVGKWYEYYDAPPPKNKKRELQYCKNPFDENCGAPVVLRAWDEKGRKIQDSAEK